MGVHEDGERCTGCRQDETCSPLPRIGIRVDRQNGPFRCGVRNRQCPSATITHTCRSGRYVPR